MMGMALTGKVVPYKVGFGPFPAEVFHIPFPIDYHGVSIQDSLAALDKLFKADVEPSRIAAMIIEPVQGEGGFYPVPSGFLETLREICDEHGIVMIVDEIQTGFGRTGKLFAVEHAGIEPDLMTVAKSLAGGFPLSGVIGKARDHGLGGAGRSRRHLRRIAAGLRGGAGGPRRHRRRASSARKQHAIGVH